MVDLAQLFAMEWASPPRQPEPLPASENTPSPVSNTSYSEFAQPSDSQVPAAPPIQVEQSAPAATAGEVPRRFSQQLAAYALESGMFDGESFELFTEDTFPGMAVDVNADGSMGSMIPPAVTHHQGASMSVSPAPTEQHTPMPAFAAPIQTQQYDSFTPAQPHGHTPPSPYSTASTITPTNGDADSDMTWINAALAQLPSEHDTQYQMRQQYAHAPGSQHQMQHTPQPSFNSTYASDSAAYGEPSFTPASDRQTPVSHQRTTLPFPSPQPQNSMAPPPAPSTSPSQSRRPFPQPQARPPASHQVFHAPPQSQPQQRQRAPGELWQTPYSQPTPLVPQHQHQYQHTRVSPSTTTRAMSVATHTANPERPRPSADLVTSRSISTRQSTLHLSTSISNTPILQHPLPSRRQARSRTRATS
ncbi:hypothetical protein BDV93DRAFT_120696 [Ceratobasidium sp. AG-I]|nr:hypothetical protein BDV93DRAFT_120696 [Ceratobasidium sp. AG-I]